MKLNKLLLALVAIFGLASCGGQSKEVKTEVDEAVKAEILEAEETIEELDESIHDIEDEVEETSQAVDSLLQDI